MMTDEQDPTIQVRKAAGAFPSVAESTSCNQTSFKTGKSSFLFVGPGPKGKGFKAMFKLKSSLQEAEKLAADEPDRFEVGSTGWVTTRFSRESPLPKDIWQRWLQESYDVSCPSASKTKRRPGISGK